MKGGRNFVATVATISAIILGGLLLFSSSIAYSQLPYLSNTGTESNKSTSPMAGNAVRSSNNNNTNGSSNKVVMVTFDDGPKNQYTIAKPILRQVRI